MKKQILILAALLFSVGGAVQAQKVWSEPEEIDPNAEVTIYADLSQMDCDKLVGNAGPLYMWTWNPADPVVGNGDWGNSNPAMEMTNDGPNIWKITFTPVDFYGVDAQTVYDNDISFLVKGVDGGSGGDCSAAGDENKTEDLMLEVNPPDGGVQKVYSFPEPQSDTVGIGGSDVYTLIYDNSLEEKPSMQNATDLYVYARAYDMNGTRYRPATLQQVGSNPDLQMTKDGTTFSWTIQPSVFFQIPDGQTLDYLELQVVKPVIANSDDAVDGTFIYFIRCN